MVLMLCALVFIFPSGSSALLGRPRCGLPIWLSLLAIFNTLFWVYVSSFRRENGQNTNILVAADGYEARKALILKELLLYFFSHFLRTYSNRSVNDANGAPTGLTCLRVFVLSANVIGAWGSTNHRRYVQKATDVRVTGTLNEVSLVLI